MRSKSNALLNAVREDDGASMLAPDELASMALELGALLGDVVPRRYMPAQLDDEVMALEPMGREFTWQSFQPLRWSPVPEDSVICTAVCELYPVRYEDGPNAYVVVAPKGGSEEHYVVRDLLFALRVLRRLAWLRMEEAGDE